MTQVISDSLKKCEKLLTNFNVYSTTDTEIELLINEVWFLKMESSVLYDYSNFIVIVNW